MEAHDMKYVTAAPFVRDGDGVSKVMMRIIIALLPTLAFAVYKYQINAVMHLLITLTTCVCTDYLFQYLVRKRNRLTDGSSIIIGILLTLLLPAHAPYYVGILGGAFAVVVVKNLLGDTLEVYLNPVLAAKCFLMLVAYDSMRMYSEGLYVLPAELLSKGFPVNTPNMLLGKVDGSMGEVCGGALLIGMVLLVVLGVLDVVIPFLATLAFALVLVLFGGGTVLLAELVGGGFLLITWFSTTHYASTPITPLGKVIYGLALGVALALVRILTNQAENVYYAALLLNLAVPLIERFTIPRPLGLKK